MNNPYFLDMTKFQYWDLAIKFIGLVLITTILVWIIKDNWRWWHR